MARYPVGQGVRLGGGGNPIQIKDSTGTLTNATSTTVTLQKPDGTTVTYNSPATDGTGLYHLDLTASDIVTVGHYQWSWDALVGSVHGVQVGAFEVFDPFEVTVLSLDDARQQINKLTADIVDDDELRVFIATAEATIENIIGGPVITRSITERVTATSYLTTLVVRKRPLVSVTSITDIQTGQAISITDIELDTVGGVIRRKLSLPFLTWGPYYTVVYTAGLGAAVPPAVNLAARIIVGHLWETQRGPAAPLGFGLNNPDMTTPLPAGYAIPNMAAELLAPYTQQVYV